MSSPLFHYDEPNRTEAEGLAFDPKGTMHVIVLAPYTTPLYATGTNNPKPFDGSYSIDGDDWNPSGDVAPLHPHGTAVARRNSASRRNATLIELQHRYHHQCPRSFPATLISA